MTPMDRNSFILGIGGRFLRVRGRGRQTLALSPPLTHQDYAQVGQEAMTMAQRHGLVAYHEENLDLPQPERFHWVVVRPDQERLEAYLALRRQGFHPRRDLTPFFGVLGYTQQRIHTGYDAFHHLFPRKPEGAAAPGGEKGRTIRKFPRRAGIFFCTGALCKDLRKFRPG